MIKVDTTFLSRRYDNSIPPNVRDGVHEVQSLLSSRKQHVAEVIFLENFALDLEQTTLLKQNVYKGLVVKLKPEFPLQPKDRAWLHPNFCQARVLYHGSTEQPPRFRPIRDKSPALEVGSSCGIYTVSHEDDIGSMNKVRYAVVDMHVANTAKRVTDTWLAGMTVKQAFESYLTSPLKGFNNIQDCVRGQCDLLAEDLDIVHDDVRPAPQIWYTNVFHRDAGVIQFSNHSIVNQNGGALVHISPLYGYLKVGSRMNVPSDLLSADQFVNVSNLRRDQVQGIFRRCHWGSNIINSTALRKPIASWSSLMSGERFKMEEAHFAPTDRVTPLLKPEYLHIMTATSAQLDDGVGLDHHRQDKIQIQSSQDMIGKLLAQGQDAILNPEFYKNGHLYLPRKWVAKLIA